MFEFLRDYWWAVCGALAATIIAVVNLHRRRSIASGTLPPVSFAAVRAFSVDELAPFFGIYRPTWRELLGYALLIVWFGGMSSLLVFVQEASALGVVIAGLAGAAMALVAALVDARSDRVLGPDRISFDCPLTFLSWSISLSEVRQCDLVPGQPYNRLRVVGTRGSRSLPLPLHLWEALSGGSPN